MEIDDCETESSVISKVGKSFSVPGFLRKVFTEELCDTDGLNHKLLAVAVHAVLLESGFVEIDPASFHYTLPNVIVANGTIESVKIKFQNLGRYCKVYGSLVNGTMVHSVLLDEDKLVPFLNVVWANCGPVVATMGGNNKVSHVQPEKEVFEFWRKIKDGISLPLLIDLCEKTGLSAPPCFMQLPTELKLKILESVSGVEIAKVSCVCSELRYLASSDDLWRQKCVEEFGNAVGSESKSFKYRFVKTWEEKKRRSTFGRLGLRLGPRPSPFVPFSFVGIPGVIGVGQPHGRGPRLRNVTPNCNLGGFAGSDDR